MNQGILRFEIITIALMMLFFRTASRRPTVVIVRTRIGARGMSRRDECLSNYQRVVIVQKLCFPLLDSIVCCRASERLPLFKGDGVVFSLLLSNTLTLYHRQ